MIIKNETNSYAPENKETLDKITEMAGIPYFNGSPFSSGNSYDPTNKAILAKIGESGGQPTYNGVIIASGSNPTAVDRLTENLYDKTRMVVGSSHNASTGAPQASGNETHKISVKPAYNYFFNKNDGIATQYTFWDSSDIFISGGSGVKAKAPANAAFLRVFVSSTTVSNVLMVMESTSCYPDYVPYTQKVITLQPAQGLYRSKWYEKTWWVLGDSITTGTGDGITGATAMNPYANKSYSYVLGRERRINIQNEAVSGYTVDQVYTNRVLNMPPPEYAPDLITLMIGTNNHGFNNPVGAITDAPAVGSTFYAGLKNLIEYLKNRFPKASLGLITPIMRNGATNGNVANAAGFTLRQYCDAVVAVGKFYSVPVLDWYYELGFTPFVDIDKTLYFCGSPSDGTHPNDLGHSKMAAQVGDFIEKL